jgi:hypothetical protein
MQLPDQVRSAVTVSWPAVEATRERMQLSSTGLAVKAGGLVALVITTMAFAGLSEDVTRHNGLATTDAHELSIFTDQRSALLVRAA